jgi:hypothetical protein
VPPARQRAIAPVAAQAAPLPVRPPPVRPPSAAAALQSRIGNSGMREMVGRGAKPVAARSGVTPAEPVARKAAPPVKGKGAAAARAGPGEAAADAPRPLAQGGVSADIIPGKAGAPEPTVALHMPPPPSGASKATVQRIQGVQSRAGGKAAAQADLPSAEKQVRAAQQAVTSPEAERAGKAQAELIAAVNAAPSPEIVALCERIRQVIRDRRPVDEDALDAADPEAEAKAAGDQLNTTVQSETQQVQDNYAAVNAAPGAPPVPKAPDLGPQPAAAATPAINATAATPDAVPAESLSLDQDAAAARQKAEDAGMATAPAQLVQNGPIAEARAAQGELDETAKEGPAQLIARQAEALGKAEADMASLGAEALVALTRSRHGTAKGAEGRQRGMVGSEESMRAAAGNQAGAAFGRAQVAVQALLKDLPKKALDEWEQAKKLLVEKFKADLAIVKQRVDERHAGVGGAIVGVWDSWTGLPGWATDAYTRAETNFADGVIEKLLAISTKVNAVIAACTQIIDGARAEIAKIFADLPESLRGWATQEQAKFDGQLNQLQAEANATRDGFNKDLKQQASAAVNEVRTEIAELRKKAGGLVGRIADAVKRFADDPAKFILEGLLELLGIPPAAFYAVIAKIKKAMKDIARDPLGFGENLLKGLGQGFSQFFDNFGTHMIRGFLTWLLGDLKGVELPKDLSLKSIGGFFLQLMGITWPNIREILVNRVGAKNVALIERVWSLVSLLIEQGPAGIVEMIKEKLDPQKIVDQIIEMAVDYMVTAIAKQVAVRLLLMFNPAGAIIQALEAIYKVLKWVFQNAARIFRLVETVVNGIADVVAGNVGGFAKAVENALGMLIPPVIAFLADFFSLGDLPKIVSEQVKKMQKWVLGLIDQAIGWIIEKGKALLAAMGIGKKDEKKAGGAFDGKIGDTVHWTAEEESHELWIDDAGGEPQVMMASEQKGPVKTKLAGYATQAKTIKGPGAPDRKLRAETAIKEASGILDGTIAAAKATKTATADPNAKPADIKAKDDTTESWEEKLWPQLQTIQIALRILPLPKTVVHGGGVKASTSTAEPLSKLGSGGCGPRGTMRGWDHVRDIDHVLLNKKKGQWGPAYWVAGHLVSERLHGPGDPWNTVPIRKTDNSAMYGDIEDKIIARKDNEEALFYCAKVTYHQGDILEDFPADITITCGSLRFDKGKWVRAEDFPPYYRQFDPPPLEPGAPHDINTLGRPTLEDKGVPDRFARAIVGERKANGNFSESDFVTRMTNVYSTRGGASAANLKAGLDSIEALKKAKKLAIGT